MRWKTKALLAVGACAGLAALYCATRGVPSFLKREKKKSVSSNIKTPVTSPADEAELQDDVTELLKEYDLYETIGEGGYGTVKLGRHVLSGETVAVKIMNKKNLGMRLYLVQREIEAMKILNHQHVCHLYHVIETNSKIYMVMEYCSGGDLFYYLENNVLSENEVRVIFRQIVLAVAYIHSQEIAHRDIKLENILIDKNGSIKLTDFGLCAKPEGGLGSPLKSFRGTCFHMAPEILQNKPYSGSEVDVWSLGVVLYEMLCGDLPFKAKRKTELLNQMSKGRLEDPDWLSPGTVLLLDQLLHVDPKQRLTVEQLLDHPWLKRPASVNCAVDIIP